MDFAKEMGEILFEGYYEGGGTGADGKPSPKVRLGKSNAKPYEVAKREFQFLLGKIRQTIVLTDYDAEEIFQCRLKMAQALGQHCIAIKGAHKGGHIYWANSTQAVATSNTKMKTVLTLSPVDYKCGIRVIKSTGEIKPADTYGALSLDDGSFREVLYYNPRPDGTLDELPFYDRPLQSGEKHQFLGMKDGDGRQDGLFTYMIPMKGAGFTYEQYEEAADLINRFVFAKPLTREFDNAKRREAWDSLASDDGDKKPVTPETFKDFLANMGMKIRYNELLNIVEFLNIPDKYRAVKDQQNILPTHIQYDFRAYTHNKTITKQQVTDLIMLVADENAYNPVKLYLEAVPWDGEDRFPALYAILGVEGEFERKLIKKWFIQTAAMPFNTLDRPFQPEGMLILHGKEGMGKTRFFNLMTPNPLWFTSLDKELTTKNKDILIQMLSAWIGEIGEFDRTTAANRSDLKNFMTLTKDTIRKPYAREPVTKARTTSFCGTTNKAEFLNNETGYRRWWIVHVDWPEKLDMGIFSDPATLQQFWAQCYKLFRDDPLAFRLSIDEIETLKNQNESAMVMIPAESELRLMMDFEAPVNQWIWIQPSALLIIPEYNLQKYTSKQVGEALSSIMDNVQDMKKRRTKRGVEYLIPPLIQNTDRFRNTGT